MNHRDAKSTEIICEEPGCEKRAMDCRVAVYKSDLYNWGFLHGVGYIWWLLRRNGLRWMWLLLRYGIEDDTDYYCPEHAREHGYCGCCGEFSAGMDGFDFYHQGLCDNCFDELRSEMDDYDDDEPDFTLDELEWAEAYPDLAEGEPCDHPGCLAHISHPCEGCGRISGRRVPNEYPG